MSINWNNVDVEGAMKRAGDRTDEKLASQVSSLTRLTDQEVLELFPEPADVKKLQELMKVVKSAEERNSKINRIVSNAEEFGGIVLTLLDKVV